MRKIKSIYVMCVLLAASLFAGCNDNKATPNTDDPDSKLPKTKGDYTVKIAKAGAVSLTGVKGSINLEKEGVGDMKLSLKDFEYTGPTPSESKLSIDFTVTLAKKSDAYTVTFKEQYKDVSTDLNILLPLSGAAAFNTLLSLTGANEITGIELVSDTKKMTTTTTVKPLDPAVGSIKSSGAKSVLEIGGKFTIKRKITLASDNDLLGVLKNQTLKAALTTVLAYDSSSSAVQQVKKTNLTKMLKNFRDQLNAGLSSDEVQITLTAEK